MRTFLDAGVLIAGARATGEQQEKALHVLGEPDRVFVASPFLYLEVIPKAIFNNSAAAKRHLVIGRRKPGSERISYRETPTRPFSSAKVSSAFPGAGKATGRKRNQRASSRSAMRRRS